jgi:hypothetical protein
MHGDDAVANVGRDPDRDLEGTAFGLYPNHAALHDWSCPGFVDG